LILLRRFLTTKGTEVLHKGHKGGFGVLDKNCFVYHRGTEEARSAQENVVDVVECLRRGSIEGGTNTLGITEAKSQGKTKK